MLLLLYDGTQPPGREIWGRGSQRKRCQGGNRMILNGERRGQKQDALIPRQIHQDLARDGAGLRSNFQQRFQTLSPAPDRLPVAMVAAWEDACRNRCA